MPPNSRRLRKSMLIVSAPDAALTLAPSRGPLRQDVIRSASIVRAASYPCAWEEAVTRGVHVYGVAGSRGVSARSSSHTLPFPPEPAVIAISIAANRRSSLSFVGPHAKEIWRFLRVTVVQVFGNWKFVVFDHHTLSPVESTSLNSRLLLGASPLIANENS